MRDVSLQNNFNIWEKAFKQKHRRNSIKLCLPKYPKAAISAKHSYMGAASHLRKQYTCNQKDAVPRGRQCLPDALLQH